MRRLARKGLYAAAGTSNTQAKLPIYLREAQCRFIRWAAQIRWAPAGPDGSLPPLFAGGPVQRVIIGHHQLAYQAASTTFAGHGSGV